MDSAIFLILLQDGIINGTIYALLALALVLIFAVTRVIFIPQGELISYGALTLSALEQGKMPGTVWLLVALGGLTAVTDVIAARHTLSPRFLLRTLAATVLLPLSVLLLTLWLAPQKPDLLTEALLALAIVTPMGPYLYEVAFRPLSKASVLVLLIAAVGVHLFMTGLGLIFFGAEGSRTSAFSNATFEAGPLSIGGQAALILAAALALVASLFFFFDRTLLGKALKATAVNRLGAQLCGISPALAGRIAFSMAAFAGALSGMLIAPITTIYYDTGFIIGLKGFVGAIIAGMVSYPVAAAAAIFVGIVESFASFWASAFKEVIVFTVIIPVLLWRSWRSPAIEEGDEEAVRSVASAGSTRRMPRTVLLVIAACVMAAIPQIPGIAPFWITLLDYAGIYSIVTIGLAVLTGAAGITSFGQAIFVGTGAYTTAVLTATMGIEPWLALPAALALTITVAGLIGIITLRLSGHYLAIATIAWNISFYYLAANLDFAGRNDGISGIPAISVGGIRLLGTGQIYYLIWATVAVAAVLTGNLLNSRMGRAIRALRGGALAAESFGIETSKIRILAFVYAAALAAAAGWLYAHLQRTVNPTPFSLGASIDYLLMIVVGGAGYIAGAIAGSAIVLLIKDQLQNMLPTLLGTQLNFEVVVFGAALVLILQYARDGFWPRVAAAIPILGPALPEAPGKAEGLPGRKRQGIATPLVSVRDLSKTFGGLVAVGGVSFDINRGEIAGLIGPNGAGKSTVFNLISGVLAPSGGKVVFDGLSIGGLPAHKIARLGMARTFQHVKLVPDMTVIENVALGAHLRGSAGFFPAALRLERHEEAKLLAEAQRQIYRVGLHSVSQKPAATLPLGQQRLVEVARALCSNPVLLLLDEPAAGLRHLEKQTLSALLHSLKEDGMTILLVEHDMDFVGGLADRLIVMNFGSKLAEGKPQAVRENPSVVEAYLGSTA